jgi:hypothetical protein
MALAFYFQAYRWTSLGILLIFCFAMLHISALIIAKSFPLFSLLKFGEYAALVSFIALAIMMLNGKYTPFGVTFNVLFVAAHCFRLVSFLVGQVFLARHEAAVATHKKQILKELTVKTRFLDSKSRKANRQRTKKQAANSTNNMPASSA